LLDTSFDQARQAVPPHEATIEPGEGGVTIRLNAECLDDAARYLIRIGCPFVVRKPEELRAVLRNLAAEIAHANAEPPHSVA
ncbi:MAG: WYL domain-containing protein, partial [Chloroflexota bacterium]|nr:WYL domain-containing protein [Chloroflexota bacterium]